MYYTLLITFLISVQASNCTNSKAKTQAPDNQTAESPAVLPGAHQTEQYLPMLDGKKVGLVVNHTSTIGSVHLADSLMASGIEVAKIFAPEHGFRGTASAGKKLEDGLDPKTGLPVISLYGATRKPTPEHLSDLDVVVFDIQDVGVRFYTYISTMSLVMEACAKQKVPVMILDRPNPNGHYVDGPIREEAYKSFVGMHPVPVVYGMTIGEYATMVNHEGWLQDQLQCDLTIIKCKNYTHQSKYDLPIKPSPNLPNLRSILLYPSLCFFEGTVLSIGRGTETQFQVIGHPDLPESNYSFTPRDQEGAVNPKLEGKLCHGESLTHLGEDELFERRAVDLQYLIKYYQLFPNKDNFFLPSLWIDKLAGTTKLREAIIAGQTAEQLRINWQEDLKDFKLLRTKYLLYPE